MADTVTLYGPDGEQVTKPREPLTEQELRLLVEYKLFLRKHNYREALYCNKCWDRDLNDGTKAQINTSGFSVEALIECRCRVSYGKGTGLPN